MDTAILLFQDQDGTFVTPMNSIEIWENCLVPCFVDPDTMESVTLGHMPDGVCEGNYFDYCGMTAKTIRDHAQWVQVKHVIAFHPEKSLQLLFQHGKVGMNFSTTSILDVFYSRPNIITVLEREAFTLDLIEKLTNCSGRPEMAVCLFLKLLI